MARCSLGLVGALSIVRFRAAIKEPEELVYLFLVIALGLAFGSNQFMVGAILLVISALTILVTSKYFHSTTALDHTGVVIIISGLKKDIIDFRANQLKEMVEDQGTVILKELEFEKDHGKIVLRASTDENTGILITQLEELSLMKDFEVNIISDVSVPA